MSATEQTGVSLLAVDDDARILNLMEARLSRKGYAVQCASSGEDALECFRQSPSDIVLVDLDMPGMSGLELLKRIKAISESCEVIVITGIADKDSAIEALKLGAFDFFEKPPNFDELDLTLRRTSRYQAVVRERNTLSRQVDALTRKAGENWSLDQYIGASAPVKSLKKTVAKLQENDRISVLLAGESGTGKELIARAIHYGGARAKRPFIPVNCAAIPVQLAESKLFGHVKGSFTGATRDAKGCFELADSGTLFLDEIGDMIPEVQAKFLRVLEDGVFVPVGAANGKSVDVRVIAATNCDLLQKVEEGVFRRDLYYRLERFRVDLPPLRDRKDDIPALVKFFAERFAYEMGRQLPECDESFIEELRTRDFPGNVRELRNYVERAVIESDGKTLSFGGSSQPAQAEMTAGAASDVPMDLNEAQIYLARRALEKAGGNMAAAARLLGISRNKLYRIMG